MLTKNFESLKDYDIFKDNIVTKDVFQNIEKIEKDSKNKNFFNLGNLIRKTAETMIANFYGLSGTFGNLLKKMKEKIYIPPNIWVQLINIKNSTNINSHGIINKSNIIYRITFTYEDVINGLRSLWFLMKFLILSKYKDDENIKKSIFDNSLYKKYDNIDNLKNMEINNNNNDISTHLMTISQLSMLKGYNFNIPTYQRDYTWGKSNIDKLIKDIEKRFKDTKTHYLGSIAVAQDSNSKTLRIIDGQQRITTSLIILKAFNEIFKLKKIKMPNELNDLINNKISNIYINEKVLDSQKAVQKILKGDFITLEAYQKKSNAFINYFKIYKWLKEKNDDDISSLYSLFVTRFQVEVLIFNTLNENEMDIFENLNTGGTILQSWDLIKNYIYSQLEPKQFQKKEIDLNKYITKVFAIPLTLSNPKKITQKLSDFFIIYNRFISIKNKNKIWKNRKNTYEKFKQIWPNNNRKFDNYNEYIFSINKIKKIFNIYLILEAKKTYKNNDSIFYPFYHTLDTIVKKDTLPLLIHLIIKYVNFNESDEVSGFKNEKKFFESIKSIEKYLVKLGVVNGFGHSQSQDFDTFLLNHKNSNTFDKDFSVYSKNNIGIPIPSNEEFVDSIKNSSSIKKIFILNILINIERELRHLRYNQTPHNPFEKTWEHILAQNLDYENYEEKIKKDDFNKKLNRWLNSIGNALILSRSENSQAGNKKFSQKKHIYKNKKLAGDGIKLMNLITKKIFTFEDIKKRAIQISEIAKEIYE